MRKIGLAMLFSLLASPVSATTYYLSPSGSDSNSGLTAGASWLSANHAVNCGDVIIAAASTSYVSANFGPNKWGKVTCSAGNDVAWLECATFDACKMRITSNDGFHVDSSYWGIQGWEVDATSTSGVCFIANPENGGMHHIIFANNIANGCGEGGFENTSDGSSGVDYLVIIGNIAYNAAGGTTFCSGGIYINNPNVGSDALPGTHIYVAGNFSYDNVNATMCNGGGPTDGQGVGVDALDAYAGQILVDNNIVMFNSGSGVGSGSSNLGIIYIRNNTAYANWNSSSETWCEAGNILVGGPNAQAFGNLSVNGPAPIPGSGGTAACGFAFYVATSSQTGDLVYNNYGYANGGTNAGSNPGAFIIGPNNTFSNPSLSNPTDPGAPNCGSASSVSNCMATVVANFAPTVTAAKSYGYQVPLTTNVYDPLFPQWLCNVNLPAGLVTMGCGAAQSSQPAPPANLSATTE